MPFVLSGLEGDVLTYPQLLCEVPTYLTGLCSVQRNVQFNIEINLVTTGIKAPSLLIRSACSGWFRFYSENCKSQKQLFYVFMLWGKSKKASALE